MKGRRWLLLMLAAAAYVALRLKFNHEYEGAPWDALVGGTAKLPFGHRVLVPWLVRPFVNAGVSVRTAFGVTEWLATVAALTGVDAALRRFVDPKAARVGSGAFLGVLGLAFLLQFKWPVFYPWDTPAIAAIAWGVALAHARRHGPLVALATLAALNRETAILLPLITVALHYGSSLQREAVRSASLQVAGVVMARLAISVLVPARGAALHLKVAGMWRIDHNLQWLGEGLHVFQVLGAFSLLPVLWVVLRSQMPTALRRLELIVIPATAGLMVVANVYEPRAWGEPLTLLYLGVAVAALRWLGDARPDDPPTGLDRWGAPVATGALVLALVAWWLV